MSSMTLFTHTLSLDLETGPDLKEITPEFREILESANILTGVFHAFVVGSTGSITTIEYETGVVEDLKRTLTELVPPDRHYAHELAWQDGNGHSHVQAALLGPSLSIPIRNSKLILGTWQQVVVINHDNGPRTRKIEITITGI